MKALSIIGIVLSALGFIISFTVASPQPTREPGISLLIMCLYFLAFSIVALVKASKNKTD
jgi:hypothetical protein